MSERPEKKRRKEALNQWKRGQRVTARSKVPLPDSRMQALFDMLDAQLPAQGCDHTLRLTRAWLIAEGLDVDPVIAWLHDNSGFCDCEALANSEKAWQYARS